MPSADRFVPHSFQARLTGAFVAVVAVTVGLVAVCASIVAYRP